jgi:hypothetical protein
VQFVELLYVSSRAGGYHRPKFYIEAVYALYSRCARSAQYMRHIEVQNLE